MLKENKRTLIMASIVTILPVFIGLYFWNRLPDVMVTHFGIDNSGDGYSSKAIAVFGLPFLCLAVLWIGAVVMANDPRKKNISPKMFSLGLWIAPVVSLISAATVYPVNLGYTVDIAYIAGLFIGVVFTVIGNYLPKARQNYTIGIKLPWTLANEENWNRTHRLAGYLWMAGGILIVVLTFCRCTVIVWYAAVFAAMILIPTAYSFWLHTARDL